MEREVVQSRVVFETAKYGAVALQTFVMRSSQATRVIESRIEKEVVTWGSLEDFEEHEAGLRLREGTYQSLWELLKNDREANKNSAVASIRVNKKGDYALEDIRDLAQNVLDNKARIRGIGHKKAQTLLEGASILIGIADASESFA